MFFKHVPAGDFSYSWNFLTWKLPLFIVSVSIIVLFIPLFLLLARATFVENVALVPTPEELAKRAVDLEMPPHVQVVASTSWDKDFEEIWGPNMLKEE